MAKSLHGLLTTVPATTAGKPRELELGGVVQAGDALVVGSPFYLQSTLSHCCTHARTHTHTHAHSVNTIFPNVQPRTYTRHLVCTAVYSSEPSNLTPFPLIIGSKRQGLIETEPVVSEVKLTTLLPLLLRLQALNGITPRRSNIVEVFRTSTRPVVLEFVRYSESLAAMLTASILPASGTKVEGARALATRNPAAPSLSLGYPPPLATSGLFELPLPSTNRLTA